MDMALVSRLWHSLDNPLPILLVRGFLFQSVNFLLQEFAIAFSPSFYNIPDFSFELKDFRCIRLVFLDLPNRSLKSALVFDFCIVFYIINGNGTSVDFTVKGSHIILHQLAGVSF